MTPEQIMEILPHRYPFLLIDRVTGFEPGKWAAAIKCVTVNEPYFNGHFPQNKMMPGVLIIEALAQTGGIALLTGSPSGGLAVLAEIKNAKITRPVVPGDVLRLECRLTRRIGAIGLAEAEAQVDGVTVCKAEMKFALKEE
jgi:3-hydroxyacyl-[acyl-carrier-protein] dehydratase